ncbi:MAG: leucine-rich repeat domain-containing protein [Promethearchaeota archaeon]
MPLTPNAIYEDYINNELDKTFAIELLKTLIENTENIETRLESIRIFDKLPFMDDVNFKFLEHILISDLNKEIKILTCKVLKNHYLGKALAPISWLLEHEKSLKCIVTAISVISEIDTYESKSILVEKIKKLSKKESKYDFKEILKTRKLEDFYIQDLADILLNYYLISFLKIKFGYIKYELDDSGCITKLDLSNVDPQGISLPNLLDLIFSLKHLRFFDLRFNHLIKLSEISNESDSIISLDLSYNNLINLTHSIKKLKTLKILNLKSNRLRSLPKSVGNLYSLEVLNLRNNLLAKIPESLKSLQKLKVLDLHGNKLKSIDLKLYNSIRELELGWNNLLEFPSSIKSLTSLEKLGISGNKLKKIPKWIGSLNQLKELELYDNSIEELPQSLGSVTTLQKLNLRNNHLKTLPSSFIFLKSLKYLNLSWNNFTSLPEWIGSLSALEELNLWGNRLGTLPYSITTLSSLKVLDLNFNKFERLPPFLKELESKNGLIIKL